MSTATALTTAGTSPRRGTTPDVELVTMPRVLVAAAVELRSLRSTTWTLLVATLSSAGFGVLGGWSVLLQVQAQRSAALDPTAGALTGGSPAVFAIAVLGLLAVTGEHATATVRSSLTAVPRRPVLLLGRALVLAALTLAVTLLGTVVAFFAARALLGAHGLSISLGHPAVLRAVVSAGLSGTVLAVLAAGAGWWLRRRAGALAVLLVGMVLLPLPLMLLPASVAGVVAPFLPDGVAAALLQVATSSPLPAEAAARVVVGYVVLALATGALAGRRRRS